MAPKLPKERSLKVYYIGWIGIDTSIRPVLATSPQEAKVIYAAWDGAQNPELAAKRARQTKTPPGFAMGFSPINWRN